MDVFFVVSCQSYLLYIGHMIKTGDSIEEHEQLVKAFKAHDNELASILMARHIEGGFNRLELL